MRLTQSEIENERVLSDYVMEFDLCRRKIRLWMKEAILVMIGFN